MDGRRISAARNAKGWSQEYLGQQIGVSQQAIAKYEGPSGDISGEKLLQLSCVLGVTVSYLLGVDGNEVQDVRLDEISSIFWSMNDEGRTALLATARGLLSAYPGEKPSNGLSERTA